MPFTFSIRHFSECCCGPQEAQNYVVRHVRPSSLGPQNVAVVPAILKMRKCAISLRPLLSSTSSKNDSNYKHSWSGGFLSCSVNIVFSSNTTVIIRILGVVDFCRVHLIFIIFIFLKEILKFWSVHGFDDFASFSYLLYFQWKNIFFGASMGSSSLLDHCYHQNHSKTLVNISIGVPDFCLGASTSFFHQTRQ